MWVSGSGWLAGRSTGVVAGRRKSPCDQAARKCPGRKEEREVKTGAVVGAEKEKEGRKEGRKGREKVATWRLKGIEEKCVRIG